MAHTLSSKTPNKFNIPLQDKWLKFYHTCHQIGLSNQHVGIDHGTYLKAMKEDPKFKALKEELDLCDIQLTRNKLRDSAHGYDIPEVRTEEEWDPVRKKMIVVKRTTTVRHFTPNSTSLIFKLCNEDADNYKQLNKVELKGKIDSTEHVITSIDDATIGELAKAIVKAKAAAR